MIFRRRYPLIITGGFLLIIFAVYHQTSSNLVASVQKEVKVGQPVANYSTTSQPPSPNVGVSVAERRNDNDSRNGRPWLLLHLGPPKTGTTSFQNDLHEWRTRLFENDRIFWGGRIPWKTDNNKLLVAFWNSKCHPRLAQMRRQWMENHNKTNVTSEDEVTLKERLKEVACWKPVVHQLNSQARSKGSRAVILSNEMASNVKRWFHTDDYPHGSPFDFETIYWTLGDDWNIMILLGYRPYSDWIRSTKWQNDRFHDKQNHIRNPPAKTKWVGQGGQHLRPLFPYEYLVPPEQSIWDDGEQISSISSHKDDQTLSKDLINLREHWKNEAGRVMNTLEVYRALKAYQKDIRILNLHDPPSMRTNFLCNILPNAPVSCQASIQADSFLAKPSVRLNTAEDEHLWLEPIVSHAGERGLIPTRRIARHAMLAHVRRHHSEVLNQTLLDLPHLCPSPTALQALWEETNRIDGEILGPRRNRTLQKERFVKALVDRKFCTVNVDAVLKDERWLSFFRSFSP